MPARIRFSLNHQLPSTVTDLSPEVRYGIVEGEMITEVQTQARHALGAVRLLPPCSPTKIVCVGRNYPEHARELGNEVPSEPLIFLKPPSSLLAGGEEILYPALSQRVDYEGELGVVIGQRARTLTRENALDAVLGYTCVNDVTARDLQKRDGQWTRGKGFDTFCPAGPYMVPKEEVDLDQVELTTTVDGEVKQRDMAREMLFSLVDILIYVTQFMTLEPGDLIATGTPPGVGPVQPGAVIRVEVSGVGVLQNRVSRG